jgi:hypothetical protein
MSNKPQWSFDVGLWQIVLKKSAAQPVGMLQGIMRA